MMSHRVLLEVRKARSIQGVVENVVSKLSLQKRIGHFETKATMFKFSLNKRVTIKRFSNNLL